MPIHFGTDGWRAVISDTFTFHNLRVVAQAIADAVRSDSWNNGTYLEDAPEPNTMVVGYDTRFLSDRYATDVARVLAGNGFKVFLTQADAPTPAISYTVRQQSATAGIVIAPGNFDTGTAEFYLNAFIALKTGAINPDLGVYCPLIGADAADLVTEQPRAQPLSRG